MNKSIRSLRHITLFAGIIIIICAGCKKKEIQGPKGEPGTPGGGGNSTISNSSIITIAAAQWSVNADSSGWVVDIPSSQITQDVADKGAVKVFVFRNPVWWELPNTQGDLFTQFGFKTGMVNLEFIDIHENLPPRPATSNYRIVTLSESARPAASNSNVTDEAVVNKTFN